MRKLIIAANWKMNKGPAEARAFLDEFLTTAEGLTGACDIAIGAPFVSLPAAAEKLSGSAVGLAAENASQFESGAYTGEVSVGMLKEVGADFVILGATASSHPWESADGRIRICIADAPGV